MNFNDSKLSGSLYDSVQVDWLAIFLSFLVWILPATVRVEMKGAIVCISLNLISSLYLLRYENPAETKHRYTEQLKEFLFRYNHSNNHNHHYY